MIDYALYTLTIAGETELAAEGYERALAVARARGDRLSVNDLLVLRSFLHAECGELQLAEDDLGAVEEGPLTIVMSAYAAGFLADVLVDRGKPAEALAAVERTIFTTSHSAIDSSACTARLAPASRPARPSWGSRSSWSSGVTWSRSASAIPPSPRGDRSRRSHSTGSAGSRRRAGLHARSSS